MAHPPLRRARKGSTMKRTTFVGVNCGDPECQDEQPPAQWVVMVEDDQGEAFGVVSVCGPCAAHCVTRQGFTVKSRPTFYVGSADRFKWLEHDGEDPDAVPAT
jgi:hypothetical protein